MTYSSIFPSRLDPEGFRHVNLFLRHVRNMRVLTDDLLLIVIKLSVEGTFEKQIHWQLLH